MSMALFQIPSRRDEGLYMNEKLDAWFDLVLSQIAAESYFDGISDFQRDPRVTDRLVKGNNRDGFSAEGFTRLADVQAADFLSRFQIIHQASDDQTLPRAGPVYYEGTNILANSGFSATL